MNYRKLGRSGLKVSEICLGAWMNFGERIEDEKTFAVLDAAVEEGIDFFDTADVYAGGKAEEVMGRWLQGKDRRTITIATKCCGRMWPGSNGQGLSRKHIIDACHDSLRRLNTDYIDLYQLHWADPETPVEETLRALNELIAAGKVRYIGVSNHNSEQIGEAARIAENLGLNKFISSQPYYNMLGRGIEKHDVPRCLKEGLGLIPYSPLAQGLLSDKYLNGIPEGSRAKDNEGLEKRLQENLPVMRKLADWAHSRDLTLSQLALVATRPCRNSPLSQLALVATRPCRNSPSPGYCTNPRWLLPSSVPHVPNMSAKTPKPLRSNCPQKTSNKSKRY